MLHDYRLSRTTSNIKCFYHCILLVQIKMKDYELIIKQGYTNDEIREFLKPHNITISLTTLKRRLQTLHILRRKQGADWGRPFRKWLLCWVLKKKAIFAQRRRVMTRLREWDPKGKESRKKKGLRRRAYVTKDPITSGTLMGTINLRRSGSAFLLKDKRYTFKVNITFLLVKNKQKIWTIYATSSFWI